MATTTTLSDAQRISQMISAEGGEVFTYGSASNDYLHNMAIPLAVTNTSMAPISAFQVVFTISVTDQLGRTNSIRKRLDCTRALAPGESFAGEIPEGAPHDIGRASLSELDAAIAIEDQNNDGSCRVGIYEINSFKTDEMAVWDAVQSGVPATITTAVTRVSFPDGTGIGTALG